MDLHPSISSHTTRNSDIQLHWLEAGSGPPVLLLHGWPTSSLLWRNILPEMAKNNRVIALDLPGFGHSDKPLDATYNFRFHDQAINAFLAEQGIASLGLCVHDLGGPVGLHWAANNHERITKLCLLNTLVYPRPSWAVLAFVMAARAPLLNSYLVSRRGLRSAMRIGVADKSKITEDVVEGVAGPFASKQARQALLKTARELNMGGFYKIAKALTEFEIPVRLIYGEKDRILPDVARTMARVQADLPQAELTALPDCGHFLQEDDPQTVARLLSGFFA